MHMDSHSVQKVEDGRESHIAIKTLGLQKVQYRTMLLSQMYGDIEGEEQ